MYEAYNIIVPFPLIHCLLSYILLLHMYIIPLVLVIILVLNTQFYFREIKFRKKSVFYLSLLLPFLKLFISLCRSKLLSDILLLLLQEL